MPSPRRLRGCCSVVVRFTGSTLPSTATARGCSSSCLVRSGSSRLSRPQRPSSRAQVSSWPRRKVEGYDELVRAYGRAVLAWAGIPLEEDADARSRQLAAIVDGFGSAGLAYARAWRARLEADRWARRLVEDVRGGRRPATAGTALDAIASSELPSDTAAGELLNGLRPTVAVAWLATFAALRLTDLPEWRARLADPGVGRDRFAFAQE